MLASVLLAMVGGLVQDAYAVAPLSNPFVWSKRIASTVNPDDEFAMGMATDSAANLYVTGWFDGTNDFGGTSLTNQSGGGQDIFVGKYNSAGELQWAQRAGGNTASQDAGRGVGVDAAGNVYVTGGFSGIADFGSRSVTAYQKKDFFLAKYNSAGVVQWVRHNASGDANNSAYGTGLTVDASGNSYAVGYYDGGVTFGLTPNTTTLTNSGDYQCFLVKYNSAGTLIWAKPLAGSGFVYAIKVALDSAGNICLSGTFTGSMNIGGTNLVSVGGKDIFVAKLNNDGVLQWAHQAGGAGDEMGDGGVAVDAADNIFITGLFSSSSITFGGTNLINAGSMDAYIAKYDSAGDLLWARQAGDANLDGYLTVAVDKQGNAYAAGASGSGAMVVKYDPAGTLQWRHSASSPAADPAGSIAVQCAVDGSGNCYLSGMYQTATTFGTNVLQPAGYWNFFLAKLFDDLPYTYTVNNGQVTITKYTGADADVTIPATINGLPVTRIADSAFYYCLSLIKVTIPSSVTTIESYAFQSCTNLTSVIIPPGVTSIGDGAFEWCYSLTEVTIPASVTSLGGGEGAFLGCTKLTAITVDPLNTVYRSVNGVLFNYGLTTLLQCPGGKAGSYAIPTGVTSIGFGAFCGCVNLLAITTDPLNTSFSSNNGVLFDPTQTTLVAYPGGKAGSYVIPANVTSIAAGAFAYSTKLSAVTIPVGIPSLGMGTFAFCTSLTSISIPAGVTSLGQYAFSSCANLASITISNSVNSIGDQAFEDCGNLIRVSFMGNAPPAIGADVFNGTASGMTIYYFNGATGFTGVPWDSLSQVNMGVPTPVTTWLVDKALPHDADLKSTPKGDGVSLLMAYALNLDPQHNLSASLPKPVVAASQLRLDYYAGNNDVTYAVETSIDLQHWTKVGVTLSDPDGNNVRKATVAMTDKRRYLRLVVEH